MIPPKIPSIRFPAIDRVPNNTPIAPGWFTLVYNPGADKTYKAEMLELPFIASADFFRVVPRGTFYNEWASGKLKPGRISRIVSRTGTRPTSDVLVQEIDTRKVGLAVEIYPDVKNSAGAVIALGAVLPIVYDPGSDRITQAISLAPRVYYTRALAVALINSKMVVPGQPYQIDFGPDANGNAQIMLLSGADDSQSFSSVGELRINATGQGLYTADVITGKLTPYAAAQQMPTSSFTVFSYDPKTRTLITRADDGDFDILAVGLGEPAPVGGPVVFTFRSGTFNNAVFKKSTP